MAYIVNANDLMFDPEQLTNDESRELELFGESIILQGYVDMEHPAWLAWVSVSGHDDRQRLLTYSTVFPQRVLLSVIKRAKVRIDRLLGKE